MNLKKNERSVLAQYRCGILPLKIETGRYTGMPVEQRLCQLCDLGEIENERHFLFHCPLYSDLRNTVFGTKLTENHFISLSSGEQLKLIISDYPRQVAKYLVNDYRKRKSVIFS
jgi:hypothetical protein